MRLPSNSGLNYGTPKGLIQISCLLYTCAITILSTVVKYQKYSLCFQSPSSKSHQNSSLIRHLEYMSLCHTLKQSKHSAIP
jgi:hypothetical protein